MKKNILILLIIFISFSFIYLISKDNVITFNSFEEFKPVEYDEETFILFYPDDKGGTRGVQVNENNDILQEYYLDNKYIYIGNYSEQIGNEESIYLNHILDVNADYLLKYNYINNVFTKEYLKVEKPYRILPYSFYGENVIIPIQNYEGETYIYDYTNDYMYEQIPYDLYASNIITLQESKESINIKQGNEILFTYDKLKNEYEEYKDYDKYYSEFYNYDEYSEYFNQSERMPKAFYKISYSTPKGDVFVNPYNTNDFYKINNEELQYAFTLNLGEYSYLYDVYHINENETILTFVTGEVYYINNNTYETKLITDGKSDKDYIENYIYEIMYKDDKYLYVTYDINKGDKYEDENINKDILVFDKKTYELVNTLTFELNESTMDNGTLSLLNFIKVQAI